MLETQDKLESKEEDGHHRARGEGCGILGSEASSGRTPVLQQLQQCSKLFGRKCHSLLFEVPVEANVALHSGKRAGLGCIPGHTKLGSQRHEVGFGPGLPGQADSKEVVDPLPDWAKPICMVHCNQHVSYGAKYAGTGGAPKRSGKVSIDFAAPGYTEGMLLEGLHRGNTDKSCTICSLSKWGFRTSPSGEVWNGPMRASSSDGVKAAE
ncbi:hypothetical protein WOLCODRAFT_20046 [Wolfiporia cocos MD-104 SS10]|uniref:Uncharacterized protein n=1 Tax=Wolfiporia cocos (strain MD-104) TaxID=742152 RepID=A0A2H3JD19_WOLCO|nr:hypothetical protein WOLCODRAFT_20046 [Wolfiporia cocos MD-104 SS10]